eukprot:Pompholyxophrys_punicea_v1_NODE_203_length_2776_cov_3.808597.p1 type:complete len:682 gc:universal NODE_203_length_2776_cov_3.808597:616-2661(+)
MFGNFRSQRRQRARSLQNLEKIEVDEVTFKNDIEETEKKNENEDREDEEEDHETEEGEMFEVDDVTFENDIEYTDNEKKEDKEEEEEDRETKEGEMIGLEASNETESEDDQREEDLEGLEADETDEESDLSTTRKIYWNAKLTQKQSATQILKFALKASLSKPNLTDLLNLIKDHCPNGFEGFENANELFQFFHNILGDIKRHHVCLSCEILCGTAEKCTKCQNDITNDFFLEIFLPSVISSLFLKRDFVQNLNSRTVRVDDDIICDIVDSKNWRRHHHFFEQKYNLALGLNTDGVSPFKWSNRGFWPIFMMVHSLPPQLRRKQEFLPLVGMWCGTSKPPMSLFLRPLIDSLNEYYTSGFEVSFGAQKIKSRGAILTVSLDAPARAAVLQMSQFNGQHGCNFCDAAGVNIPLTKGTVHVYPPGVGARRSEHTQVGVKGVSVLYSLVYFTFAIVVLDYMHCVCLGVMRALLNLWCQSSYSANLWYISPAKRKEVWKRLRSMQVPHCFSAIPKNLENLKQWKAVDYLYFLLYFGPVVLRGILPDIYYNHFLIFSRAIHTLIRPSTLRQRQDSQGRLDTFVIKMRELYGLRHCSYNVHCLQHCPECVEDSGPLPATSCFPFESMNSRISRLVIGFFSFTFRVNFVVVVVVFVVVVVVVVVVVFPICPKLFRSKDWINSVRGSLG